MQFGFERRWLEYGKAYAGFEALLVDKNIGEIPEKLANRFKEILTGFDNPDRRV